MEETLLNGDECTVPVGVKAPPLEDLQTANDECCATSVGEGRDLPANDVVLPHLSVLPSPSIEGPMQRQLTAPAYDATIVDFHFYSPTQ